MYTKFLLFLASTIISISLFGQIQSGTNESCGHAQVLALQKQHDPFFEKSLERLNDALQNYQPSLPSSLKSILPISDSATRVIPVVVHIVRNPADPVPSIPYAQVEAQINALNAAFALNYPAYNGQSHGTNARDIRIQFCLAQIPAGPAGWSNPAEPGVMRYSDAVRAANAITVSSTDDLLNLTHPSATYFPFENYLNIWVVQSIGGLCSGVQGYAVSPLSQQIGINGFTIDGVVLRADVFGDNSTGGNYVLQPHTYYGSSCVTASAVNNQGKVLVHEVGHYLNLFHTFQNDIVSGASCAGSTANTCASQGDFVCDTPPSSLSSTYICGGPNPNSCGVPDMVENYMYYAQDPCMNTFTEGQKTRMRTYLDLYRSTLSTIENQIATGIRGNGGCIPPQLLADFTFPGSNCTNTAIPLSSIQGPVNTATSYLWTANGGTISNPTAATTDIQFSLPGNYTVSLTVSDGVNSETLSHIVPVSACQLDPERIQSAQWYYGQYAQVDFLSGSPVPTNVARVNQTIFGIEGGYTYCDSSGNMVFYTDGINLWDNTHTQINSSIIFPTTGGHPNSVTGTTQPTTSVTGLIGVPFPDHPNEFFLFSASADEDWNNQGMGHVRWVHVDLNTSTIDPPQNLTAPGTRMAECLTIVPHCNGVDYWVITPTWATNGSVFKSYLISALGVSSVPVTSPTFNYCAGIICQMKGAPDNSAILVAGGLSWSGTNEDLATYSFDNATGVLSNEQIYDYPGLSSFVGCSFSPNSEQIYGVSNIPTQIIQFDRTSGVSTVVSNSADARYLQLGPDGHIYVGRYGFTNTVTGRINNPDTPANAGAFTPIAINFATVSPSGSETKAAIPHFMDGIRPAPSPADFSITLNSCNEALFELDPCWDHYAITWDFGDGSPTSSGTAVTHTYAATGTYYATCYLSQAGALDSVEIQKPVVIYGNSTVINGFNSSCIDATNTSIYSVPYVSGSTYTWTVSANGSIVGPQGGSQIEVDWLSGTTGTVSVAVTSGACVRTDTKNVSLSVCGVGLQDLDEAFGVQVYPNPTSGIFTISKPENFGKVLYVQLTDVHGKKILASEMPDDVQQSVLDISILEGAIYFLQFRVEDQVYVRRISKQ